MKAISKALAAVAAFAVLAACGGQAHAQQQTGLLGTQIPLHGAGQGKTYDTLTGRYISFASNDAYVIDADGIKVSGSLSLSKVQAMATWKNYLADTPLRYINTATARFECSPNYQTLIYWAGHGVESRNDNCSLFNKVISQSDTN